MPAMSSGMPQRPAGVRATTRSCRPWTSRARGARQVGVDPARQHGVDLDVVLGPGGGQRPGQLHDAALAGAVGRRERRRRRSRSSSRSSRSCRRRPPSSPGRRRGCSTKALVRLVSITVCHSSSVVLRQLADVDAGIVDQDVEPAERFEVGRPARGTSSRFGHVDAWPRPPAGRRELLHRGLASSRRCGRPRPRSRPPPPGPGPCRGRCRHCRR